MSNEVSITLVYSNNSAREGEYPIQQVYYELWPDMINLKQQFLSTHDIKP